MDLRLDSKPKNGLLPLSPVLVFPSPTGSERRASDFTGRPLLVDIPAGPSSWIDCSLGAHISAVKIGLVSEDSVVVRQFVSPCGGRFESTGGFPVYADAASGLGLRLRTCSEDVV